MKSNVASLRYMLALLICFFLGSVLLNAQGYRATLDGRVTDSTGASVPSATVTATNVAEGTALKTKTGPDGRWTIPFVSPGVYDVTVQAKGFKKYIRERVVVHVNDLLTLNIPLEVGELQQSVTVSGATPLLTPESASLGQVVTNRVVIDMPLNGRNVLTLVLLTPGVLPNLRDNSIIGTQPAMPYDTGSPTAFTANGAPAKSNMFLLGGVMMRAGLDTSYVPPVDAVQEFKMQKNPYDAEYGHAAGAIANIAMKTGTNEFHGTLFAFHRNSVLDANGFFSNKVGKPKIPMHYNQFGGTIGGPVRVPGYDGKNRTFWFVDYEGLRQILGADNLRQTVPSDAQRSGDFSATRAAGGAPVTIYDPFTVAADPARPGQFIRQPFAGSKIPQARINPVSQKILDYWPRANNPGDPVTGLFNLVLPQGYPTTYNQINARVDHNISDNSRLYGMVGLGPYHTEYNTPNQSGYTGGRATRMALLDYVRTITPHLVMNINYGYNRAYNYRRPYMMGFDITRLGFPSSLVSQLQGECFPITNISDMYGLGTGGYYYNMSEAHNANFRLTRIQGRHTMKMGMFWELVHEYSDANGSSGSGGSYSFDPTWTQADPLRAASGSGNGLASFMLGIPTTGQVYFGGYDAAQRQYWEFYFHDDFKVNSRLTLNLGMRWEYQGPDSERYDRTARDFNFNSTQPIEAAARANYANNPIPQVPVDSFVVRGNVVFTNVNGAPRSSVNTQLDHWAPRLGIAYRVTDHMVWRAGSGVYYASGLTGISMIGFQGATPMVTSIDGIHPLRNLSDPYPNGVARPGGYVSKAIDSLLGWSVGYPNPDASMRRTMNWSTGFQYELPHQTLLDVAYVGSRTYRFTPTWDYNAYDAKYLALGSQLNTAVPNPFFGLIPASTGPLGQATVQLSQLLRPFPEYQGSINGPINGTGQTRYNSMQVLVERRFAAGFGITGAYTYSKVMYRNSYLNPGWSNQLESVIGDMDYPQRLVVNAIGELPFGKGKAIGGSARGLANQLIGGWEITALYTAQRNISMAAPSNAIATGQSASLSSGQSIDNWFNKQAFAVQPSFTMKTLSSRIADVRLPGLNNWDAALLKDFPVKERIKIQFRAEFFNAFNHVMFGGPDLNLTGANFGKITTQQNIPRQIQFGLKVLF